MLEFFVKFFLATSAIIVIILVMLQRGKGGGLAGALGGMGGQSAFGTKAGDLFTKITVGVATFWIIISILTAIFAYKLGDQLALNPVQQQTQIPDTAPAPIKPADSAADKGTKPADSASDKRTKPAESAEKTVGTEATSGSSEVPGAHDAKSSGKSAETPESPPVTAPAATTATPPTAPPAKGATIPVTAPPANSAAPAPAK